MGKIPQNGNNSDIQKSFFEFKFWVLPGIKSLRIRATALFFYTASMSNAPQP